MVRELEVFLAAEQTTAGSAVTSLNSGNYHQVVTPESRIDISNPDIVEINTVGDGYGQDASVIGKMNASVNLRYPLRSWGTGTPDYLTAFKACGYSVATAGGFHTLTPSSTATDLKDLTIWHYSGARGSNASFVRKVYNVMLDWKIAFDTGGPAFVDFSGVGCVSGVPAAGTQPTCTKNTSVQYSVEGATCTVLGTTYKLIKCNFDGGNVLEQRLDPTATYGYGATKLTKRKIKFGCTFYTDIGLAEPLTALLAGTETTLSVQWGTKTITLATTKAQITGRKIADNNSLEVFEITGQCNTNDFTITIQNS